MKRRIYFLMVSLGLLGSLHAQECVSGMEHALEEWRVAPEEELNLDRMDFLEGEYNDQSWVRAQVPGTIFSAYVQAGLEKDPNFGDNIHRVDRSKYNRTFWYRTSFTMPQEFLGRQGWLCFQGVNRKATIYLNGKLLGQLDGFMQRGRFLVSKEIKSDQLNTLAVRVEIPQTPLANQGSPNYLSSGGWDWMPYVPGLNAGITDKVWLESSGAVVLRDPWIRTKLPSLAKAELTLTTEVENTGSQPCKAQVSGVIQPGGIAFSQEVELNAGERKTITFDKRYFPQLVVNNPQLWWPNGYGEPTLYTCELSVVVDQEPSMLQKFRFGIREYAYDTKGGIFHLFVNRMPVFVKGGNWGMSEYLLRCRGEEYKLRLQLHKEMHFNMIRNWLGSVTDEDFYRYCDEFGIMVWDDFWINSNPNVPYDLNVFNLNMVEKIKRLRNHACIAVWCGDNEGTPEPPLTGWMAENIRTFDGGDRWFQPCSNTGALSGSGPWGANDARWYFTPCPDSKTQGEASHSWGFRTEIGTAVMPSFESFRKFMPQEHWWPIDEMWNTHYFGPNAGNATPDSYVKSINERYGEAQGIEDFCRKAQLVNLESNKAMFEGWVDHIWDDASGIMTWMSQAAYPCMVWQTYDYYYDLTGAYWGCRGACEPLHVYWNPVSNEVKVANTTRTDFSNLQVEAQVLNLDGKPVEKFNQKVLYHSISNTAGSCFTLDFNTHREVISKGCPAVASSTTYGKPEDVTDCNEQTRWAAVHAENEWIYIDLQEEKEIGGFRLNWEAAYGKSYKIQISHDALHWKEVYKTTQGSVGVNEAFFPEVKARYVRMLGIELGWWYGYSLYSFDVLGPVASTDGLDPVHFIRLSLKDGEGQVLSQNLYWRGNNPTNLQALNSLEKVEVEVSSKLKKMDEMATIEAVLKLPKEAPNVAFAVNVQAYRTVDGERILPAIVTDNYFTLVPGESKKVTFTFKKELLKGGTYRLKATPYNSK